ncbi:TolC family protein [Sulfurospirillum sp. 1307]
MRLKILLSVCLLASSVIASDSASSYLSSLKKDKLEIDKKKVELESDNLKFDWINQIKASYSYSNSDITGQSVDTGLLSVTFNQPIFKSGGIYYAIKYSGANREFMRLSTKLNEQSLVKTVFSSLLLMKKYDFQIQKQKLMIENAKIDVMRKKEQYESGLLDSSFLDSAILDKNKLEIALLDLESLRYSQLMKFKSYSDLDYKSITPPKFSMIEKTKYLDESLLIQTKAFEGKKYDYLEKMTMANYLPTVSLYGGLYDKKIKYPNSTLSDSYNQIGISISMPLLDINRGRTIELRRLDFLKSKLDLADTKVEEENNYNDSVKKIELLQKKIALVKKSEKLYASLLNSTKESYEAGEKTIYDVDTLKNSMQTTMLDQKIYELDIQQVLLDMYAKMHGEI